MTDIFEPHRIATAINKDFNSILKSYEMKSFEIGLQYKSEKTKRTDTQLMNLLLNKLSMYKNGWISSNALQTSELFRKSEVLDECFDLISQFNDHMNKIIIDLKSKGKISDQKLNDLREIETKLRSVKP